MVIDISMIVCATLHLRRWTQTVCRFVEKFLWFCVECIKRIFVFWRENEGIRERARERIGEKRDLLIDLLGVSDGDKCHAIDHHAYKFQKSIEFFFGLEKWTFPWTSTVCTALYWWAKRGPRFCLHFFRLFVLRTQFNPSIGSLYRLIERREASPRFDGEFAKVIYYLHVSVSLWLLYWKRRAHMNRDNLWYDGVAMA